MALGLLRHCFGDKLNGPSLTHLAPMQSLKQSHFQGEKLRLQNYSGQFITQIKDWDSKGFVTS